MNKQSRWLALLASLALLLIAGAGAATTASAKPRPAEPSTVTMTGTTSNGGTLLGTFDVSRFQVDGSTLEAVGTLAGTITNPDGTTATVNETIQLPVNLQQSSGSCQILHLVLGPLDLDLLGLQVHLNQVVLDITAQQGPGNLLGNLLCAIAGLLDAPTGLNAILQQIANLLNQLLGVLG